MRIPGIKTAKNFSRWLQARVLGGALILGYHRIAATSQDGYQVSVSPENFAGHMESLRKYVHPIKLSKLVQGLKAGSLAPKSVAVTFDDGYADNLYSAKPILEKYEIPATVFICTGYIGREFWWDELERLVIASRADLYALHIQIGENRFEWNQSLVGIKQKSPQETLVRRRFHQELYQFLLKLDIDDLDKALDVIRNWSGRPSDPMANSRALNEREIHRFADGGLIELGAHTRNHLMLHRLSFDRQRDEILSSKRDLEMLWGKPVHGFSYPNGRSGADAKRIVREAGFAYACTSLHDVVRSRSDRYELTRFWQKDVNGDKFLQHLRLWMKMSHA